MNLNTAKQQLGGKKEHKKTHSADEDSIWFKAPEQLLKGPRGEIEVPTLAWKWSIKVNMTSAAHKHVCIDRNWGTNTIDNDTSN